MTLKRKLGALQCQNVNVNLADQKQVRNLVVWLEKTHIKHCSGNEIKGLENIGAKDWNNIFAKYLQRLNCPIAAENVEGCLDWCAGYAVRIVYAEGKDKYAKFAVENLKATNVPSVVADNPLDHIDFTSKEFKEGINKLATILKVTPHFDPLITLEGCSKVVQTRLHIKAIENPQDYVVQGTPFPFREADLGFDLGNISLNEAAKMLRLLYIHDLRDLQTKSNECIVAVQSVTANPKTDTKLGKVGI